MEANKENPSKSAKPPSPSGCKINVHPQQQEFHFSELTLDSCFDSGNMANASRISETQVSLESLNFILMPSSITSGLLQTVLGLPEKLTIEHGFISEPEILKDIPPLPLQSKT